MILLESFIQIGKFVSTGDSSSYLSKLSIALISAVVSATVAVLLYRWKKKDDDVKEQEKKDKEKETDYKYMMVLLKSIIKQMEEQAGYYLDYSNEFKEKVLFETKPLQIQTFHNLKVFLEYNHNKFYQAYLHNYRDKDITTTLSNFEKIFEQVSELELIKNLSDDVHNDFIKNYKKDTPKRIQELLNDDLLKSVFQYVLNGKNEDLKVELNSLIQKTISDLNNHSKDGIARLDGESLIIKDSVLSIHNLISKSNEKNDPIIINILHTCVLLINLLSSFPIKSLDLEIKFKASHDTIKERIENLKKLY